MNTFLSRVATYVLENYGSNAEDLTVVFPNKRAGLYLKNQLATKISKTTWLPLITSIESFITDWSGVNLADPLKLHFDLIEIHLELGLNPDLNITDFSNRAEQFLRDFDEIDHYLVDAEQLFSYLTDAKAIELWHADGSSLTEYEKKYLAFYKSLLKYYHALKKKLDALNAAYPGMLFRNLAEADPSYLLEKLSSKFILFAGFNALTPAEEKMMRMLIENGRASILWDLDAYYFSENQFGEHEAGLFARRINKKMNIQRPLWVDNTLLKSTKKINFIAVPGNVSQAKAFASDFLQQIQHNPESCNTSALVLADESLLTPVINSIPDEAGRFNVTMGLPFHFSPVYQIIQALFDLHLSLKNPSSTNRLPSKKLLMVLSHNMWGAVLDTNEIKQLRNINAWMIESGRLFVDQNDILEVLDKESVTVVQLVKILTQSWNNSLQNFFECMNSLIQVLAEKLVQKQNSQSGFLLLNHLSAAGRIVNKLENLLYNKSHLIDLKGLKKLFRQIAPGANVSLYGEPLEGLQVMGLLESRNLSFDIVYLLSANEGILPGDKNTQSLIPYDIKRKYGLPTHHEKQAVYAYNFFRLIQSASHVHLYYNSVPDILGGGEKSRYLLQIEYELTKLNPRLELTQKVFNFPLLSSKTIESISINKDKNLMRLLDQKASKGFSPTSLATFISCPLRFYLKELLYIQSPDELEESIGMDVLGTIVHRSLQELYTPYRKELLNKQIIQKMKSQASIQLKNAFDAEYKQGETEFGKNRLITEVAETFVARLLNFEEKSLDQEEIIVLELEASLRHPINMNGKQVLIKGLADRIDKRNGRIHIIDYKTGRVEKRELSCANWEEFIIDSNKTKALQLLIYTYLYAINNPDIDEKQLVGNIISLRKLSDGLLAATYPEGGFSIDKAEDTILQILEKIFDQDLCFEQTTDIDNCKYCDFKDLCNRKDPSNNF